MTRFFAMVPDVDGIDRPAFFLTRQHAPKGAAEISETRHAELLVAQGEGKRLYRDEDGTPRYETPRLDADQLRAGLIVAVKREAGLRIDQVAPLWRQMNDAREPSEEGARRFAQIDAIRAASGAIEDTIHETNAAQLDGFPVRENPLWPELD